MPEEVAIPAAFAAASAAQAPEGGRHSMQNEKSAGACGPVDVTAARPWQIN